MTDFSGCRTFGITAEGTRKMVEEAYRRAFNDAIQDIEFKIIKAARAQEWGVVVNMYHYDIESEDIATILDLLENRGFIVDDKHEVVSTTYEVYITWDDEYVRDQLDR